MVYTASLQSEKFVNLSRILVSLFLNHRLRQWWGGAVKRFHFTAFIQSAHNREPSQLLSCFEMSTQQPLIDLTTKLFRRVSGSMALPHMQRLSRPPTTRDHNYYVRVANDTSKQRQWNSARCMERRYNSIPICYIIRSTILSMCMYFSR